jgi:hypothetical protein
MRYSSGRPPAKTAGPAHDPIAAPRTAIVLGPHDRKARCVKSASRNAKSRGLQSARRRTGSNPLLVQRGPARCFRSAVAYTGKPAACNTWQSGPVSRILFPTCPDAGKRVGSSSVGRRPFIWARRCRRARAPYPGLVASRASSRPLFGLAGGGVCPATTVTGRAVRSYRTISPLPV